MQDTSFISVFSAPLAAPAAFTLAQDGSSTSGFTGAAPAGPAGAPGATGAAPIGTPAPNPGGSMMFIFLLPLVALVLFSMWANKKERKKRESLISSVGKHDVVLTVGGIIGTVTEIQDDKIILRVDDSTKTKIAFAKSSIQQVIRSSTSPAEPTIQTNGKPEKANV